MKLKTEFMNKIVERVADKMSEELIKDVKDDCEELVKGFVDLNYLADKVTSEFDAYSIAEELKDDVKDEVDIRDLAMEVRGEIDVIGIADDLYEYVKDEVMEKIDTDEIASCIESDYNELIRNDEDVTEYIVNTVKNDVVDCVSNAIIVDMKDEIMKQIVDDDKEKINIFYDDELIGEIVE